MTLYLMDAAPPLPTAALSRMLEGGYDLKALASSVAVHVQALMRGTGEPGAPEEEG